MGLIPGITDPPNIDDPKIPTKNTERRTDQCRAKFLPKLRYSNGIWPGIGGATTTGVTLMLLDEGLDTGPIIAQAVVPVEEDDTTDSLAARVLTEEHRIYPQALKLVASGALNSDQKEKPI